MHYNISICFRMEENSDPFVIVEFIDESTVEAIPSCWLTGNGKFALWPTGYSQEQISKARIRCTTPNSNTWVEVAVRKLGHAG